MSLALKVEEVQIHPSACAWVWNHMNYKQRSMDLMMRKLSMPILQYTDKPWSHIPEQYQSEIVRAWVGESK